MSTFTSASTADQRLTWVEPTVIVLDVAETAANTGSGADKGQVDQNKS